MAKRFDLGMSINYCANWGIVEATREFIQNAFDEQVVNPSNTAYINYDADEQLLLVGNKTSKLETSSLLLGSTTKADSNETIGQFGEGYKVATVVLLRLGKTVTIYNRCEGETWTAKVVKSRRYKTDVVVYDIEKPLLFNSVENHDLIFEIGNVTPDEFESIKACILQLQSLQEDDYIISGKSRVLLNPENKGKLFVGGLFVCQSKYATYGYDFEPAFVKLDRDRGFIDNMDLQFLCSKVLVGTGNIELIRKSKDIWDGEYIRFYLANFKGEDDLNRLYEDAYIEFKQKYGESAIPTTDHEKYNTLRKNGFNVVLVSSNNHHYITHARSYDESKIQPKSDGCLLAEELERWYENEVSEYETLYEDASDLIRRVLSFIEEHS